jgi:hypothetical protein
MFRGHERMPVDPPGALDRTGIAVNIGAKDEDVMDLKSITRTLALLSVGAGAGLALTACASKKDAQEVTTPPAADATKAEGGCGGEAGCGGAKKDGEGGCGGEAGCGGAKKDGEAACGGAKAEGACGSKPDDASAAEAPTAEPEPTTAEATEAAAEPAPAPAKKKKSTAKKKKPAAEMACGEGTCA